MRTRSFLGIVIALVFHGLTAASQAQELHVNPAVKDCSIELDPSLTQSQFHKFIRESSTLGTFKLLASAEPLGAKRFQVGIDYSTTRIDDSDPAWNNTFTHPDKDHYLGDVRAIPKLIARMGLSDRVDAGVYFTKNPQANYGFLGGEVKYALFKNPDRPVAVAIRSSYVTLLGVDDMNFHIWGMDVSASQSFGKLTPYVGAGINMARGIETTSKVNLHNETVFTPRGIIGAAFSISFISIAAEVDIAALSTLSFRTGFGF